MRALAVVLVSIFAAATAACGGSSDSTGSASPASTASSSSPSTYSGTPGESLVPHRSSAAGDDADEAAADGDGQAVSPAEGAAARADVDDADTRFSAMGVEEFAEVMLTFMEQMAELIDANKDDCDAMADGLEALFGDNAALVAELQRRQDDEATQAYLEENHRERMNAVAMKMMGGVLPCADHPRLKGVMDAL